MLRRHRPQAAPELGARHVAPAQEQIADEVGERLPTRFMELG
jgi:hypothetical protein